jgi:hypothetical protein
VTRAWRDSTLFKTLNLEILSLTRPNTPWEVWKGSLTQSTGVEHYQSINQSIHCALLQRYLLALVQGCSSASLQRSIVFFVCAVVLSRHLLRNLESWISKSSHRHGIFFEGALLPQRPLGIHLPKTQSRNLNVFFFLQLNAVLLHFILSVLLQLTNCEMGLPVRILMILQITQVVDGIRSGEIPRN